MVGSRRVFHQQLCIRRPDGGLPEYRTLRGGPVWAAITKHNTRVVIIGEGLGYTPRDAQLVVLAGKESHAEQQWCPLCQ